MDLTNITKITISNIEDTDISNASAKEITLKFKEEFDRQNPKFELSTLAKQWVNTDLSDQYTTESEFIETLLRKSTTDKLYNQLPDRVAEQFLHFFQLELSELR